MALPLKNPFPVMEALLAPDLPEEKGWLFEPKWDGFRCLIYRDSSKAALQSKSNKPLERYFPEVTEAVKSVPAKKFILDGELTIQRGGVLSFDDLLQRIHPAASRIQRLSRETPATMVVFDMLVDENGRDLTGESLEERRERLEFFFRRYLSGRKNFMLSPAVRDPRKAKKWLKAYGSSLDGLIAKRLDAAYESGERSGAVRKIKTLRSADCVVGGFRYSSKEKSLGSLLLGLYDEKGLLNHVGFTSSFSASERKQLLKRFEALVEPPGFTGSAPGGPSRWSTDRSTEWKPLKQVVVVEVEYDHFTGGRFRHGTKFLRFRPDKAPRQCKMSQVTQETRVPLAA